MSDAPSLRDVARWYASFGWPVFPVHSVRATHCSCGHADCAHPGKHPRTPHGFHDATTDPATLHQWWTHWPDANLGIPTGAVSGLLVLDIDPRHGGHLTVEDLEAEHGTFPPTVESLTGGGGRHLFYAHPGGTIGSAAHRLGPGVDLKADGGYVIVPPSVHASGQRYLWEASSIPGEHPLAPVPAWIPLLDRRPDRAPRVDADPLRTPVAGSPGADFTARAPRTLMIQLLERHGWTVVESRDGIDYLRRPGKQGRAFSATLGFVAPQVFHCFTTNGHPFACGESYSSFAVYTLLEHHGDYHAAAKTLALDGFGAAAEPDDLTPEAPAPGGTSFLPYSEQFNAEALVRDCGTDLRYCHPFRHWYVWRGTHWQEDATQAVMRRAKTTVKSLALTLSTATDADAKALLRHLKTSLSAKSLKGVVELASSERSVLVTPNQWDVDPWLLNCANGTLDLRTGALRDHDRGDHLTHLAPVPYDPTALCPTWEKFLVEIFAGQPDLCTFVQRAIGYSLTGDTSERVLFLCWGTGRNGKSTLLECVADLLGTYAYRAPTDLFLTKPAGAIPNDVAQLPGRRFVHASETTEGQRLSEALLKDLTGRDTLSARFMRGEFFQFRPICKLWLRTNHKPVIRGTDQAIWDRLRLIPFVVRIDDHQEDKALPEKLRAELPGILSWAVQGCLDWQRDGLSRPPAVTTALADYRADMDLLGDFLEETCVLQPYATTSTALFAAYLAWCHTNSETPLSRKAFTTRLVERDCRPEKGTHGVRLWRGIGLRTPEPAPRATSGT
jgi:putative DNA primase/helicase